MLSSSLLWRVTRSGSASTSMLRRVTVMPGLSRGVGILASSRFNVLPQTLNTARLESTAAATMHSSPNNSTLSAKISPESVKLEQDQAETPHFDTLSGSVSPETLRAIISHPFNLTNMSPVQAEVLPLLPGLADPYDPSTPHTPSPTAPPRDLLVKAKTGTGKTLAFLVPAIEARYRALKQHGEQAVRDSGLKQDRALEWRARKAFAKENAGTLVISPTRELAAQIAAEAIKLTSQHDGFEVQLLVGGADKRRQIREWRFGRKDIVVATPGRLRDLLNSEPGVADALKNTQLLVLDEADTLLDMGFQPDIDAIKEYLPPVPQRQTFLFSATVSRQIQAIAKSSLSASHRFINCVSNNTSPVHAHVEQYHTVLPSASHQVPHLLRLLAHDQLTNPGTAKTIVFLPTTKMTQLFASVLRELSRTCLPAGRQTKIYEIHSKRAQESRDNTSRSFRNDNSGAAVLVTSDVSARGVDYPGVTRVIQVGIPGSVEQYVHRVGRTGRAGTQGRGDLILLPWERGFVGYGLGEVPLKPLTVSDTEKQLVEVAERYEKEPQEFFKDDEPLGSRINKMAVMSLARERRVDKFSRGDRFERSSMQSSVGVTKFVTPLVPVLGEIEKSAAELTAKMDPETIREAFTSLLGYYMGKTQEMRIRKKEVLEGCQEWSTGACGLETPPWLSDRFLKQLGFGEDDMRDRRRGRGAGRGRVEPEKRLGFGFKKDLDGEGSGNARRVPREREWVRERREDGPGRGSRQDWNMRGSGRGRREREGW